MDILNTLERRFGHFAIPGLVRVIVSFNVLIFILRYINPNFIEAIDLQPAKVMQGEVWRLVSYIFIPPAISPIFMIFFVMFYWMLNDGLEEAWGAFRLNVFFLLGMIGTTVAAFMFGGATTNAFLNLSILFAFATLYPEFEILFMLILPLKMKWVGAISAFFIIISFLSGPLYYKAAILVSFANYFLFFGPTLVRNLKHRGEVTARRNRLEKDSLSAEDALHTCASCGKTELSDPDLEFRVAADGEDYCEVCIEK